MRRIYKCQEDSEDKLQISTADEESHVCINLIAQEDDYVVYLNATQCRDLADQLRAIADKADPNSTPDITGDSFL